MLDSLDRFLRQETPIETQQKQAHQFVPDLPVFETTPDAKLKFKSQYFFTNKDIYISKHHRYAPYPDHSHEFLELNYMYSGSCTQIIDGHEIVLKQHDILLMDIGSEHAIKALGPDDILINILFQNQNINLNWLEQTKSNRSLLFNFLINNQQSKHSQFLLFQANNSKIVTVLEQLLSEYYFPEDFSDIIISHYLTILLTELMRNYQPDMLNHDEHSQNPLLNQIFKLIETDYAHLSLASLAEQLNYNKNYLSNLIKSETHFTFTELLNKQKLLKAHLLISSTRRSIDEIINEIGYSNKNYFYKEYKKNYHELPTETRKQAYDGF
ncbi:helix-turn-helix domain-containing protein [Latilactobacillus fuchuensis]|uniref:Transcriptional regulator of rhamnose utilization, AraC family n=1 Tax=Latilactobacillus fuchuensis TaxID=164393 RepID=A0A2N9DUU6_9LACO|nr:helix-turn-helix domain-containing protein [Latilactobacillus fuchuensis]SPC37987.1 Transcriptional regulator of rhamnose utilization, AraC family [Latilactobacillus fuchuensis]